MASDPLTSLHGREARLAVYDLGPSDHSGPLVAGSFVNFWSPQLHASKVRFVCSHIRRSTMKQETAK
jgi:hypothetical protein